MIYKLLANRTLSHRKSHSKDNPEVKSYLYQKARLKLRNGVLYRQINTEQRPDRKRLQLCLPKEYRKEALEGCYDNVGHFGVDRTIDLLRDRFYWPYMLEDTKEHVGSCQRCQMAKGRQQLAPLQPYHASAPMELVHVDYLTIEHGKTGTDVNILIITDHYSRLLKPSKPPTRQLILQLQQPTTTSSVNMDSLRRL